MKVSQAKRTFVLTYLRYGLRSGNGLACGLIELLPRTGSRVNQAPGVNGKSAFTEAL
ncbi:MAG: hypothetical protein ABSD67_10670 [Terracidiphilus sp.]|jgi:hypothetical protein